MAEPYSTRRKTPTVCKCRVGEHLCPKPLDTDQQLRDFYTQLREVSRLLSFIYSTCATAELALHGQNADQDRDILTALRMHVSEPVSRQVQKLASLVVELGGIAQEIRP
jgi:hypothetical protein